MTDWLRARLRRLAREDGTTLIETTVASGILVIMLVGLLSMGSIAAVNTENQGHLSARTTEYAQDKMEQLLALAYSDTTSSTVVFPAASSGGTGLAVGGSADTSAPASGYVDWLGVRARVGHHVRDLSLHSQSGDRRQPRCEAAGRDGAHQDGARRPARPQVDDRRAESRPVLAMARRSEAGFSLLELLIATALLLVVTDVVTSALLQITQHQQTIWNRTEMHSGIRGATELLQQEIGQAGRITLPSLTTATLDSNVAAAASCDPATPTLNAVTVGIDSSVAGVNAVSGMFADSTTSSYEMLTVLDGDNQESIRVASIDATASPPTITACFENAHNAGTVVTPLGAFATGIVPPTGVVNGSTANLLKLYGDINGDGNMMYIEYYCDNGDAGTAGSHNLYRRTMAFNATSKPALDNSMILLSNVYPNPTDAGGVTRPCFQYQTTTMLAQGTPFTFVLDVAVTLTVQTEQIDPITKTYQTETKALLNVSPRNVFGAWELASAGYTDRIQSTPATVANLMALP
jgi:Tfp pilus assembly protein PilW